jgi:DNA-binding beta-propeller fold protein YncE
MPKPPEQEIESSFLVPVVTGKFVWSANPTSGRVALIDASSLAVRVYNAGFGPKYLAAIPGGAGAIVINELSHDATLFRMDAGEEVRAYEGRLPIHEDANAWSISPDGAFALAWSDASGLDPLTTDASLSFQDVSVVSILEGQEQVTRLVVGYRPTQLVVNAAATRAFAVTEDGISVIELGPVPHVSALYDTTSDPLADVSGRDVSISADGKLAFVKVSGSANLDVVDLDSGELSTIVMSGPIEDLDLAADGARAFAVIGTSEVVVVPVPIGGDPSSFDRVTIDAEAVASIALSNGGEVGLLYMNALPNSHVTILDTRAGEHYLEHRTVDVKGPVRAVFPAPNAETAIVFQDPMPGSTKAGVFSVVPTLSERSAKIVGVDAAPTAVAFSPDGKYALVTTGSNGSGSHGVYRVKLDNLQEDLLELASPPITGATGLVPEAARGFVAQAHPEGRITFIELESGLAHTLTGFELAAKISYGTDR